MLNLLKTVAAKLTQMLLRPCKSIMLGLVPKITKSSNTAPKLSATDSSAEGKSIQAETKLIDTCHSDLVVNDFYNLIGSLTDLCDELKLPADHAAHTPSAEQFRQMLINKMELVDVLLIQEPMWDISKQRAVKIASQDGAGIKVLSSVRTGISYRSKIIRKEEVIISK